MFLYSYRLIVTPRVCLGKRRYREWYIRTPLSTHLDSWSYHDRCLHIRGGDMSGFDIPTMFLMSDVRL